MKLQKVRKPDDRAHRKMVHIHTDVHSKIQQLSIETGIPMHKLVETLLIDALTRVELIDSEDKEET